MKKKRRVRRVRAQRRRTRRKVCRRVVRRKHRNPYDRDRRKRKQKRCSRCGEWNYELYLVPEKYYDLVSLPNQFALCAKCEKDKKLPVWLRAKNPRRTRRNPDIEYHDRSNKYRGVTYMSVGHDGDGILWIYKGGKILTHDSFSEDEEEQTHDTAFGPGHFWQGRFENSSRTLSVLPPFRSEDRKVPVKILNLLISEFRPKKILAFI